MPRGVRTLAPPPKAEPYPLGPEVRPGARVPFLVSMARDEMGEVDILAVVQNGEHRIPFVLLGEKDAQEFGRMRWSKRNGGTFTWGVTHRRPWESATTLDEAIADMQGFFGPLEVLR